jgi:CBS domain containing-hemolysin-like protein
MPDHSRLGDSVSGDADSSGGLLKAIRKLFDNGEADTSLRAQLEEAIDEHEDEHATGSDDPGKGDLSPIELITPLSEGVWDADARAELDDVATIVGDARLAEVEEAVDTLGGLAFVLAGQVPRPGAMLAHPSGWRIEVTAGDETHVTRLRLHQPETAEAVEGE